MKFDGLNTTVGYLGSTNSSVLQFPIVISGSQYGYKNSSNTFVAFRGDSTDTYTYVSGSTGGTVDLGARNNYRYINATNVYNKGVSDGYTTHTGTYTFPANDTGGTKDLGVSHTYRYVNATNVYNKGKADGYGVNRTVEVWISQTGAIAWFGINFTFSDNTKTISAANYYFELLNPSGGVAWNIRCKRACKGRIYPYISGPASDETSYTVGAILTAGSPQYYIFYE